jgi:hypothetical protein
MEVAHRLAARVQANRGQLQALGEHVGGRRRESARTDAAEVDDVDERAGEPLHRRRSPNGRREDRPEDQQIVGVDAAADARRSLTNTSPGDIVVSGWSSVSAGSAERRLEACIRFVAADGDQPALRRAAPRAHRHLDDHRRVRRAHDHDAGLLGRARRAWRRISAQAHRRALLRLRSVLHS